MQAKSLTSSTILRDGISCTALAMALAFANPAIGQSSNATLQGHVEGATAGTTVTVTDTFTGQKRVGKIDESGNYEIIGLRPSTYQVEVPGEDAKQTTLLVGQTAVVDFGATSEQTIIVSGRRQVLEVRTPSVATNVTPEQIENLPQNKRNFLEFAKLAPGVAVSRGGNAQIQAGAVSSSNVNVLLDGISIKNPINHGGVFGQNFGLGNPFPQIAIQEYKVETQNFGAETGQAGSALLTAITKTGGDEFHGSAFIQFQPNWLIEQPYFDKQRGLEKPAYNRKQFGGDIGGPIIPGKLTFYLAGEGTIQNLPGLTGNVVVPIPTNLADQINVSHNNDFKQGLYFGKLTYYATDFDTVNLSAFIRRENNLSDIDGNATESHARTILTHQDRFQANWQHDGDDWFNTLNVSYETGEQSTPSVGTGPEYILSQGLGFDELAKTGAHFFNQGDTHKIYTVKNDTTVRKGDHTIKFGGQVAFMQLSRTVNNRFNGTYYYVNPGPVASFDPDTAIPYGARINLSPTASLTSNNTQIGVYLQDEWRPDEHWTFNFGLRWDLETKANNNDYVTPTAIATAIRNYPGWQARGINPEDYISNGNNRDPEWTNFQPRIGFSYDVNGDRDLVIFGGLGRYYDRSLFIEGVIEKLTNIDKVVDIRFCTNGQTTDCVPFNDGLRDPDNLRPIGSAAFPGGGSVFLLNNETKMPYSDQFDIGVRKRFGDIQTSLTLSHVRSHNIFMFTRANFYENGWYTRFVTRDDAGNVTGCSDGGDNWIQDNSPRSLTNADGSAVPTSICAAQNAQLDGFGGKLNIGSNEGEAKYTAIYLQVEKPFTANSTWGFSSALTVQWAKTNVAQEFNSDEFFNGADQTGFGWQKVNGVTDWNFVTTANWRAPWDITFSGTLELSSGPRFGSLVAPFNSDLAAPDGACCIANFAGVYSPPGFIGYKRLDLRIAKTFELPFASGHEVTVDFQAFNVFNWLNRTYSAWNAGAGDPPPLREDSQIANDARSFQAGIKYKF